MGTAPYIQGCLVTASVSIHYTPVSPFAPHQTAVTVKNVPTKCPLWARNALQLRITVLSKLYCYLLQC